MSCQLTEPRPATEQAALASPRLGQAPKLLVVDDDEGSRRTLAMILESKGFDVQVADCAAQSVRLAATRSFDLALVDVRLPDGLGTAVIPKLQGSAPGLAVIMMTAYASVDDAIAALNNGASGYLIKPLNLDEVLAVVRESLLKQSLARENAHLVAALQRELADRIAAEVELERLRAIIESTTTDLVAMATPAGDFLYINRHGRKMIGLGEGKSLAGLTIKDLHPAESFAVLQDLAMPTAAERGAWTGEITFKNPASGADVLTSMTLLAHKGTSGEVELFSTISRDITAQRGLERQLRTAQRMEAVGRVAGGVAHDFNNLLQVILGYAAEVRRQLQQRDPLYASVGAIVDAGEKAAKLTSQLLAFSRRQTQQLLPVDIGRVVTGLEPMLRRLIGEDIELCVRQEEASVGFVIADEGQLEQVLMNLVVNARDAMPEGGRITIETCQLEQLSGATRPGVVGPEPGSYVLLSVSDTGCGMDEETQSHIFEPFFSTKPFDRGTGLGLSTVYGIVKQHGGFITVDSRTGVGTTLRLYFPRSQTQQHARAPQPRTAARPGTETILLVEDEPSVRVLARGVLQRNGFRVLEAANGEEAVRVSEEYAGSIELLLTDVVMPKLGGRQVAERLKHARPGLRVLFMSGYSDDATLHRGGTQGVAFLAKPFLPSDLISAVCTMLDERRATV